MGKLRAWIIGIIVVVILCYSGLWYYEAQLLKSSFVEKRGKVELAPAQDIMLNFEDIKTSGFPFNIHIALINPKIDSTQKSTRLTINYALTGQMINTFSPFGTLKKVQTEGKAHIVAHAADTKPLFECFTEGNMTLQSKFKGYIWSAIRHPFSTNKEDFEDLLLHLAPLQFSCSVQGKPQANINIKDATFHYQKKPDQQIVSLASDFVLDTTTATPNLNALTPASTPETQLDIDPFLTLVAKEIVENYAPEKTACAIDATIELPSPEVLKKISNNPSSLLLEPFPTFSINVKKLNTSNSFGSFQHSGYIVLSEDSPKIVTLKFKNDAENTYLDAYYTKTIALVDDIAKKVEALGADNEDLARIKALFHDHLDAVKALIPKLQEYGKNIWSGEGSFEVNRETYNFAGNISNLGFKNNLYGFLFNLNTKREGGDVSYKSVLQFINYQAMIQDFTRYFNNFTTVFDALKHDDVQKLNPISDKTKEKIVDYLAAISDDPKSSSPDLKITVSYENGAMKIGTLDLGTFMGYSLYLKNALQKEVCPPAEAPKK